MIRILVYLFLSGLIFGSGFCLVSCGPILISCIAASAGSVRKGLLAYVAFSLARIFSYIVLGLAVFFLGQFALERFVAGASRCVLIGLGAFIIFLGIVTALGKGLQIRLCQTFFQKLLDSGKYGFVILGLFIGFLPCAPLLAVLFYISLISKTWIQSAFYSFSFGIGTLISPLLLLACVAGFIPHLFLGRFAIYGRVFNIICGIIIVFLGLQLLKGQISTLQR